MGAGGLEYDCATCNDALRARFGCDADAPSIHFRESPHPTRRCPHWHIKNTPHAMAVWDVYVHTDGGKLGLAMFDQSPTLVQAVNCVLNGVAYARKQDK